MGAALWPVKPRNPKPARPRGGHAAAGLTGRRMPVFGMRWESDAWPQQARPGGLRMSLGRQQVSSPSSSRRGRRGISVELGFESLASHHPSQQRARAPLLLMA
ncbi:hypothetical protein NDU88_011937 [Pleurodeles waltl]|uniref:Uncharacterized protein n=1 Tax=Pleurodeles waltl TaxID=8319 RepID=A0AAV7QZ94_PLEWA|nr:hypothetical protein NDU88_011937 [Pleurodeles waltl]